MPITRLPPGTGCNAASVVGAAASVPLGAAVVALDAAVVSGAAAVVPAVVPEVTVELLLSSLPHATATRPRLTNAAAMRRLLDRCLICTISPSVSVIFVSSS